MGTIERMGEYLKFEVKSEAMLEEIWQNYSTGINWLSSELASVCYIVFSCVKKFLYLNEFFLMLIVML